MFKLTLHDQSDPIVAIDSKNIGESVLRVGRDPSSDWVLKDPERTISRHHLEVRAAQSKLLLRAVGRNEVYSGDPPRRIPRDVEIAVPVGDAILVGPFQIRVAVCAVSEDFDNALNASPVAQVLADDYSLFDAFCEGAQIDPSQLIADDPQAILREAGAIYREAVLGVSALLRRRSQLRSELSTGHTVIAAHENNIVKWAPANRLVVDLLTNKQEGFKAGAPAMRDSFDDITGHVESLMSGHRSAMEAMLEFLRPNMLEAQAPRGILRDHAADCWVTFTQAHAELERLLTNDDSTSSIKRSFARGYEKGGSAKRT